MRRIASRYIAGETLPEALTQIQALAQRGHAAILDILGEDVTTPEGALGVANLYLAAAEQLAQTKLDCYVSVKPTHVGLRLGEALALQGYQRIAAHLMRLGLFLRVEMEDHTTTDATLRVFEVLAREFENVGIVLQSRLLRTPKDIQRLAELGPINVRLVKGIYLEPAAIAHVDPKAIRDAYLECSRLLLDQGAFVSYATHDAPMADDVLAQLRERQLTSERYEFQVLLGVQEHLWAKWKQAGHAVRVYVPYGPEWRPYSLRRLKKNPEILGHVMRAALGLS